MPAEAVAGAAASLFALAQDRPPGQARLRVLPPGPGPARPAGRMRWPRSSPTTCPSWSTARSARWPGRGGWCGSCCTRWWRCGATRPGGCWRWIAPQGAAPESMMRITLGAQPAAMLPGQAGTAPDDWAALEAALARALADVRLAVGDFAADGRALRQAEAEAGRRPRRSRAGRLAFLRWMAEDNFVLLGHRRLALAPEGRSRPVAAENLGLLRDAVAAGLRRAARPGARCRRRCARRWPSRRRSASPRPICAARCTGRSMPMWWRRASTARMGASPAGGSSSACSPPPPTTATRAASRCWPRRSAAS